MSADFAISTEVTTKNSASPVLRQVARDVKHLAGDIKTHIGDKLSKPWASFTKGTREAIVGVTIVGEVPNTSAPLPVSSLITPANCAEVVAA